MAGLDQIVAEDCILRKTAGHRLFKGIHVIDSFPDKRSLLENVLIDVRYRARVRVNPHVARKQFNKPGTASAWQTDTHARLQNAVPFSDHSLCWIKSWPIQRMGHRSCQLASGITRQLCIGV